MTQHPAASFAPAWSRFSSWLAEHAPADHAALRPKAQAREVSALEVELGFGLHPELAALLRLHNGVAEAGPGAFLPLGHRLIGTTAIAEWHGFLVELGWHGPDSPWDEEYLNGHAHQWVPFALPNDGGMAFVDHRPGPGYGYVHEMGLGSGDADGTLWATGPGELFALLADAVEGGTPFLDHRPRIDRREAGRSALTWDIVSNGAG